MTTTTLRQLNGFDDAPAKLADATLVMVDFQNTYTRGVMELDGWEAALKAGSRLLARAREEGATVVHIMNDGGVGTPYDITAEIGQIHPDVAPLPGESVVVKSAPNAFVNTDLESIINAAGNDDLVLAGFMTNMCVTFTAEGAFLRGKKPTVVADACATRTLDVGATVVPAEHIHFSALATIGDLYGVVVPSVDDLG